MRSSIIAAILLSAGTIVLSSVGLAAEQGPSTAAKPAASDSGSLAQGASELQEIVVTAQKRSEDAQTVPVSLSVLTGADMQEQGFRDVSDLAHLVPGVSVQRTGPAENSVIM